jgi:regulatory protein
MLEQLALRYVERFATTRAKLARYLTRKVQERGWSGDVPAPIERIVARLSELGYVNDRLYGEARARGLERRGYGLRRVGQDLRAAGLDESLSADITSRIDPEAAALTYARKRRFGPFASEPLTREVRARQFAAMLRAGHDANVTALILSAGSEDLISVE